MPRSPAQIASILLGALLFTGCGSIPTGIQQDANGRYTVSTVPKVEGRYQRVNADTVRIQPFFVYKIYDEDSQNFYVKNYEPVAQPLAVTRMQHPIAPMTPLAQSKRIEFAETDAGLPQRGQWRESFAIADMNGDGRADIVLSPARKTLTPPVVFVGAADGRFSRWTATTFPKLPYDYGAVAVADYNGDGRLDIAIASHLVGIAVLLGDGKGGFSPFNEGLPAMKSGERSVLSFSSKAIRAVDWDGDGRIDLVVQQEAGGGKPLTTKPDHLAVFLNRGDRWQLLDAGTGEGIPGDRVGIADLDGDGRPDAVLGSALRGDKRLLRFNRGATTEVGELSALPDGAFIETIAAGDVSGDGRADILVSITAWDGAQWISGIDMLIREGGGRYAQRPLWREATPDTVSALLIVDLDGDGRPDVVALRKNGGLMSFVADGQGSFTADTTMPAPPWRTGCTGVDIQPIVIGSRRMLVASFSGEPSALDIPPRCRNEGGLALIAVTPAR